VRKQIKSGRLGPSKCLADVDTTGSVADGSDNNGSVGADRVGGTRGERFISAQALHPGGCGPAPCLAVLGVAAAHDDGAILVALVSVAGCCAAQTLRSRGGFPTKSLGRLTEAVAVSNNAGAVAGEGRSM